MVDDNFLRIALGTQFKTDWFADYVKLERMLVENKKKLFSKKHTTKFEEKYIRYRRNGLSKKKISKKMKLSIYKIDKLISESEIILKFEKGEEV